MAPTTRTCSFVLALSLLAASPAGAKRTPAFELTGPATFVGARAAALDGDLRRSALLYAALAEQEPGSTVIAGRAISAAIASGDTKLALRLAAKRPISELEVDAKLLLAGEELRRGKEGKASAILRGQTGGGVDLGFLAPLVEAWRRAEKGDASAIGTLSEVPAGSAVAPYLSEHRALMLLKLGKPVEAEPIARRAIAAAGRREARVRIALADGFMRNRDRERALAMLEGREVSLFRARQLLQSGRRPGAGIDNAADGFAELLLALSLDLARADVRSLPLVMIQVARHASPDAPQAPVLLGSFLGSNERPDEALVVLRGVGDDNLFSPEAQDTEIRTLLRVDRDQEALARALAFAAAPDAQADDQARVADVLAEMGRHVDAADALGRALAMVEAGGPGPERWVLNLLRGGELEQAERWAEAKVALEAALAQAPENPLVLNYLGYAKLERGENLDRAEQLIAKASALAPDNASITDSLGWAQFKRGRVEQAIATLQQAAAKDPSQAEIQEHLGDALYTVGRKFEARHAWNAALITAEDEVKERIESKLEAGLTPANAAP
ncbi:tetratricopeptide repeat protein [Sphingomonas arenae]|uniref:tetratricopeptide repeat protein n=1 Tax=Sphingomonas arenae TaxID=2812555 RepID=UPI0019682DC7